MRAPLPVLLALALLLCLSACGGGVEEIDYTIHMNTDYPLADSLPAGEGEEVDVILLLGQSNASGCSITEYLALNTTPEEFAVYEAGFENLLVNYCIDDHSFTSRGVWRPVDLTCGCGNGFFGPEVGMAETLSRLREGETFLLLKYTMSGYSLGNHWLRGGERSDIYHAFLAFAVTYLGQLEDLGYVPRVRAVCWMQGESDTAAENAARYYDNQVAFVDYLRADLAPFSDGPIHFIDAGISSSPYCEPGYPTVNEAKAAIAALSPYNHYFSTIDEGLTTLYEPDYAPDLGHYDSLSEIRLGQLFGEILAEVIP